MIRVALLLVAGLASIAGTARADGPDAAETGDSAVRTVTLREAAAEGIVVVRGVSPRSYRQLTLKLANRSDAALDVDLAGSWVRPTRARSSQRLGLGPLVDRKARRPGRGTILVRLERDSTRSVEVQTVCLDAGLPAPTDQTFVIGADPMPKVREVVMRWWADHPDAPQQAVNAAIWQNRSVVHAPEADRVPKGRLAAAHAGSYYALDDGELTMVDPDGIRRFLGTQVHRVVPTSDAVFAVGTGRLGHAELWRLALTGATPWAFLERLPVPHTLVDVQPAPEGELVLIMSRTVRIWNRSTGLDEVAGLGSGDHTGLSHRRVDANRLAVVVGEPGREESRQDGVTRVKGSTSTFVLYSINLGNGRARKAKTYWNVRAMVAGRCGIFGLSPAGDLRRLAGDTFRDLAAGEWTRIVGVGSRGLWVTTAGRKLRYLSSRGVVRAAPEIVLPDGVEARIDLETDDIVFADDTGYRRIRAAGGAIEKPLEAR